MFSIIVIILFLVLIFSMAFNSTLTAIDQFYRGTFLGSVEEEKYMDYSEDYFTLMGFYASVCTDSVGFNTSEHEKASRVIINELCGKYNDDSIYNIIFSGSGYALLNEVFLIRNIKMMYPHIKIGKIIFYDPIFTQFNNGNVNNLERFNAHTINDFSSFKCESYMELIIGDISSDSTNNIYLRADSLRTPLNNDDQAVTTFVLDHLPFIKKMINTITYPCTPSIIFTSSMTFLNQLVRSINNNQFNKGFKNKFISYGFNTYHTFFDYSIGINAKRDGLNSGRELGKLNQYSDFTSFLFETNSSFISILTDVNKNYNNQSTNNHRLSITKFEYYGLTDTPFLAKNCIFGEDEDELII